MEQINDNQIVETIEVGTLKTFTLKNEKCVKDLLKELKLSDKFFAILVNGKRANLNDMIKEGSSIILLPKIAGG
jgi:sulfur carrier protein ThiS